MIMNEHNWSNSTNRILYKEREGEVVAAGAAKGGGGGADSDIYEKVLPKHGDALFHKFVSVIQENPGQVLR